LELVYQSADEMLRSVTSREWMIFAVGAVMYQQKERTMRTGYISFAIVTLMLAANLPAVADESGVLMLGTGSHADQPTTVSPAFASKSPGIHLHAMRHFAQVPGNDEAKCAACQTNRANTCLNDGHCQSNQLDNVEKIQCQKKCLIDAEGDCLLSERACRR
jgi:hypothetical protein